MAFKGKGTKRAILPFGFLGAEILHEKNMIYSKFSKIVLIFESLPKAIDLASGDGLAISTL